MSAPAIERQAREPLVLWEIVDECLDEAAFLWRRRDDALEAPDRTPDDVANGIEERLAGAIDGLGVAGGAGVDRVLGPALESEEPLRVAVAAHALLAGGTEQGARCFQAMFLGASDNQLQPLRRGLELLAPVDPKTEPICDPRDPCVALAALVRDSPASVRAAHLEACAFRGLWLAPRLDELLFGSDEELQRAAARLLRHAPHAARQQWMPRALEVGDVRARQAAVESGLIVGARGAWECCREMATTDLHAGDGLLLPLAMLGARKDHDAVVAALGRAERQRNALWALGFGGRRAGADACVDMLAQDRHVQLAAEALGAITGLDLDAAGLVAPPEPVDGVEPPAFADEDLDANLVPTVEERLPAPNVPEVIRWWNRNRARFNADTRYFRGRPVTLDLLLNALANGPMRRRHAIAFELAVHTQGRLQVQTRAFIADQRRCLAAFAAPCDDATERTIGQETSSPRAR